MNNFPHIVFVALGSNKGERLLFIQKAIDEINNLLNTNILDVSSIYETKPFGIKEQNNFYNAVVKISTNFSFKEFHLLLKQIEKKLGRKITDRFGPREIDLDLLFFDDLIFKDENLTIPHYAVCERDFVLIPLKEISNDHFHPVLQQKISDICINENEIFVLKKLEEKLIIKKKIYE